MLIAAIGGATGSGKTTLAKHLGRIVPSLLVFQDDFAPPEDQIPIDERYGWQDWDDPDGAIDWEKQRRVFDAIRETGEVPPEHSSHDHLNEQVPVEIEDKTERKWTERFARLAEEMGANYPSVTIFRLRAPASIGSGRDLLPGELTLPFRTLKQQDRRHRGILDPGRPGHDPEI